MKKILFRGIMLLTACTMLMVGCKKDNSQQQEPDQPTQPTKAKLVSAVLEYSLEVNDDMRLAADFTVSYFDANGQVQTEKLTSNSWSKTMNAALPAKLGVRVVAVQKEGFNPADYETMTMLKSYSTTTYCLDENGNKVGKEIGGVSSSLTLAGEKVPAYFEKYQDYFLQTLYSVDADGNKTNLDEWK